MSFRNRYKNQLKKRNEHCERYDKQLKQFYKNRIGSYGAASPVKYIDQREYLSGTHPDKPPTPINRLEAKRKYLQQWADTILKNHRRD